MASYSTFLAARDLTIPITLILDNARYQNMRAFGAVAAMVIEEAVANYAYKKSLFVLTQAGENMTILNSNDFQPKSW